jgi:hypothetical protein
MKKAVPDGATGASDGGEGACERDLIAVPRIVLSGQPQDVGCVSATEHDTRVLHAFVDTEKLRAYCAYVRSEHGLRSSPHACLAPAL